MNEPYALIVIGVCIFGFLLLLIGIGSVYGGSWETVASGVATFTVIITIFSFAAYVLVGQLRR